MTAIWWIRRDLRLTDNAALHAALERGPVLPVFIIDPAFSRSSPRRMDFQPGAAKFKVRPAWRRIYPAMGTRAAQRGCEQHSCPVGKGDQVDDDLALYFTKELK